MSSQKPWVIVTQDEGLIVEVQQSLGVNVLVVDYDEAANNHEYLDERIGEVNELIEFKTMPEHKLETVLNSLQEIASRSLE